MDASPSKLAVIGGSGLYDIPGLKDIQQHRPDTPFGETSAPIITGMLNQRKIAFLARHGKGHPKNPSNVNYRANIFALKILGVEQIISVNTCGSLREDYKPGDLVIPDQIFDHTKNRTSTFFDSGLTAHISSAEPFCPDLSQQLVKAARSSGANVHPQGKFIIIEGPRFSTRLESNTFRSWGMSIIGMTAAPEAFLAREAEICYASIAHITDYDVWHTGEDSVTVEMVLQILHQNTQHIQSAIQEFTEHHQPESSCACSRALEGAILTQSEMIPPETREKLHPLIAKYL